MLTERRWSLIVDDNRDGADAMGLLVEELVTCPPYCPQFG